MKYFEKNQETNDKGHSESEKSEENRTEAVLISADLVAEKLLLSALVGAASAPFIDSQVIYSAEAELKQSWSALKLFEISTRAMKNF